jgi:ferrous iron transport protein B
MTLDQLKMGEHGIILKVKGRGAFRKRIVEMGFVAGKEVSPIKTAPLLDPVEYSIMGYNISLRRNEARLIEIAGCDETVKSCTYEGMLESTSMKTGTRPLDKSISIALVGNPNCGKTTIFNSLSGSQERVGNYSGVTVEAKESVFKYKGYTLTLTDLPGTYSITAYTPEELYVRSFILDNAPDIVVNVVDSSNLERNLYLTSQLIDMDIKVILALNMYDEIQKRGDRLDYDTLSGMLGIPMIPTVGSRGKGLIELLDKVIDVYEDRDLIVRHIHINYGNDIEKSIQAIQQKLKTENNRCLTDIISSRFLSVKLLEKDRDSRERLNLCENAPEIHSAAEHQIKLLEAAYREESETIITDAKYGFIAGALRETFFPAQQLKRRATEAIDAFLTNKLFGFPFFFAMMWLMFQGTFTIGQYPVDAIDIGVKALSSLIEVHMPVGVLKDLVIEGIIGGVGGVIIYLPNILILFFFISLMEDTGYMARAAFIMDKVMHRIGLHGKSFIPLIMGFGCNVPAIMATRTIESRNDRLVTILITPFMSCSARLPVYVLFIGVFFPSHPGTVLFVLYGLGIIIASLTAVALRKFLFKSQDVPFVMELPPYRMPTLKSATRHMWDKGVQYLKKMGGVILIASIIIWALGHFPTHTEFSQDYDVMTQAVSAEYDAKISSLPGSLDAIKTEKETALTEIEHLKEAERQEKSYIGRLGKVIQPVLEPLGFDWRIGVSLLTGLAAKEIVVSSLGVLLSTGADSDEQSSELKGKLISQTVDSGPRKGQKLFTPVVAFAFMIFILIYFPCIATITAMKKEIGSYKWPLIAMFYSTGAAWLIAFAIYQVGSRFILH